MGARAVKVFATTGSEGLALEICQSLQTRLPSSLQPTTGLLGEYRVERFSNGNLQVQVDNVRGHFVVVIHTQVPPVNDHLVELLALLDAVENARPRDVLLVFPYMPYARSDRKNKPRISTLAPRLARILNRSYDVRRVILLDPHDTHTKHYFEPAADEISALYLFADYVQNEVFPIHPRENCAIVFADAGAAKRFGQLAYLLKLPVAYIDKDRPDDEERPELKAIVGDVKGKTCLMVDDEILTGSTVLKDTAILLQGQASTVIMLAIHAPLDDKKTSAWEVVQKLEDSPLQKVVISNSIPVAGKITTPGKFVVLSVAPLLAEAISRTVQDDSLTMLHNPAMVHIYRK